MKKYKYKKQISLGFDSSGKQIRKWIYADSKAELNRIKVEMQGQWHNSTVPMNITFGDYYDRWLRLYKSNKEINTQLMYEYVRSVLSELCVYEVREITSADIQEIINANWEYPEKCKKIRMALRAVFKRAQSDELIRKNPVDDLEMPKCSPKEKRALNETEKTVIRSLLALNDKRLNHSQKIYVALLYYFGLRSEEARAVKLSDFNLTTRELKIERACVFDHCAPVIKGTKTNMVRSIPIPDAFLPLLEGIKGDDYIFLNPRGLLPHEGTWKVFWYKIKNIIIPEAFAIDPEYSPDGFMPYTFRRNYATMLYYSGISIKKAAYYMGHVDTKMILKVYAQIDDARENIDALRAIT